MKDSAEKQDGARGVQEELVLEETEGSTVTSKCPRCGSSEIQPNVRKNRWDVVRRIVTAVLGRYYSSRERHWVCTRCKGRWLTWVRPRW